MKMSPCSRTWRRDSSRIRSARRRSSSRDLPLHPGLVVHTVKPNAVNLYASPSRSTLHVSDLKWEVARYSCRVQQERERKNKINLKAATQTKFIYSDFWLNAFFLKIWYTYTNLTHCRSFCFQHFQISVSWRTENIRRLLPTFHHNPPKKTLILMRIICEGKNWSTDLPLFRSHYNNLYTQQSADCCHSETASSDWCLIWKRNISSLLFKSFTSSSL